VATFEDLGKLGYSVKKLEHPEGDVYRVEGFGLGFTLWADQQDVIDDLAHPDSHKQRLAVHKETLKDHKRIEQAELENAERIRKERNG
jgi:hypothetical protein